MKYCSVKDCFSPSLYENVILHFVKEQWLTLKEQWLTLVKCNRQFEKKYGTKGHDQFTKILFKPVMINIERYRHLFRSKGV